MSKYKFRGWNGSSMELPCGSLHDYIEGMISRCGEKNLMQYIWIKDRRGVEVFEGDIVDDGGNQIKVVKPKANTHVSYGQGECGFHIGVDYLWGHGDGSEIEIIGNIHENPELLEG